MPKHWNYLPLYTCESTQRTCGDDWWLFSSLSNLTYGNLWCGLHFNVGMERILFPCDTHMSSCMHSGVRLCLAEKTDSLDIKGTTVDHHFRLQTATVNLSDVQSLSGEDSNRRRIVFYVNTLLLSNQQKHSSKDRVIDIVKHDAARLG